MVFERSGRSPGFAAAVGSSGATVGGNGLEFKPFSTTPGVTCWVPPGPILLVLTLVPGNLTGGSGVSPDGRRVPPLGISVGGLTGLRAQPAPAIKATPSKRAKTEFNDFMYKFLWRNA